MTAPTPPIEDHRIHSQRLIEHAEEELAKGDRLQASEKAWGAVVHQLKAVAEKRGWKYDTHRQVYPIIEQLAEETGTPIPVNDLFDAAAGLHRNYYVDSVPLSRLAYQVDRVKALLEILNRPELMRPPRRT